MYKSVLEYKRARKSIQDADLIFFRGKGFLSSAIMNATSGRYSHVEMAQWNNGLLMSMGATSSGTVYRRLSSLGHDCSKMAVGRVATNGGQNQITSRALGAALSHLGKPYDFARLVQIWISQKLEQGMENDLAGDQDAFICSEFVAFAYRAAGQDLVAKKPDHLTTPADLFNSELVEKIIEFKPSGV